MLKKNDHSQNPSSGANFYGDQRGANQRALDGQGLPGAKQLAVFKHSWRRRGKVFQAIEGYPRCKRERQRKGLVAREPSCISVGHPQRGGIGGR